MPENQFASRSVIPGLIRGPVRAALRRSAVWGAPVQYGPSFRVSRGALVRPSSPLQIGMDVSVGRNSVISVGGTIGDYVLIGMQVQIIGRHDHAADEVGVPYCHATWVFDRTRDEQDRVNIGRDVWIGAAAVILSGVTIGEGALVAAGSIVTKDVAPYSVVAGNPAREVNRRFADANSELLHSRMLDARNAAKPGGAHPEHLNES